MITAPEKIDTPFEPTTPLKISEAMRLGAMVTNPGRGNLWSTNNEACAIGAALIAWGRGPETWPRGEINKVYDYFGGFGKSVINECPVTFDHDIHCVAISFTLVSLILHLNDRHGLPREWIADFLESIGL